MTKENRTTVEITSEMASAGEAVLLYRWDEMQVPNQKELFLGIASEVSQEMMRLSKRHFP